MLDFHQFLQGALLDPDVSEILVNGNESLWLEKSGRLISQSGVNFDDTVVRSWARELLSSQGRRLDFLQPYADGSLECGSRIHIVGPPVVKQYCVSIRKQVKRSLSLHELVRMGSLSDTHLEYLLDALGKKKNIFISGGTGSGKTTFLSALIQAVSREERIVAVEDVSEIQGKHPHFISLLTRNTNQEGEGEVSLQDLLRQTLRMRPDRIVLGECRGPEAMPLLLMLNTGHAGSMGTIHANSTREALHRLETLSMLHAQNVSSDSVRRLILGGIQVVIQLEKKESIRKVASISELKGFDSGNYLLKEI